MFKHIAMAAFATLSVNTAHAAVGYADVVIDFFDSGVGPLPGPYGGTLAAFPVPVSTSVVLGNTPDDFLSLPTGSFITVGFTDELVFDGAGPDIFVGEIGGSGERADVFVSSDFINFTLLGTAIDSALTPFDLASIGWVGDVVAVKIVGLDNLGGSPGFDVTLIQVLPGAFIPTPAPAGLALFGLGVLALAGRRSRS